MSRTVSVVVCSHTDERWQLLSAALESLADQTCPPDEVILVIDHNPTLLTKARSAFPDALVIENTSTSGLSGARNSGVMAASGEVIAFLDDDAVAEPDWLERLLAPYEDTRVVAVGGRVDPSWEAGKPEWFPEEFNWVVGCTYTGHRLDPGPVRNVIGCNMSLRRAAIESAGGFRAELGRSGAQPAGDEETELSIQVTRNQPGSVVWYEPAAVVSHFVPSARTTWTYFGRRCFAEGRSKAILSAMVGASDALASEWSYTRRVLPRGVLTGIHQALTGRSLAGLARAAAIVLGLTLTTAGYLWGTVAAARRRRLSPGEAVTPMEIAQVDPEPDPHVTVIVATRDRAEQLHRCLRSLLRLDYSHFDIVVVDNAPSTDETRHMLADRYGTEPGVHYLQEAAPGLARAHNRGLMAASGSIVAFTDDDIVVDRRWLSHIVTAFGDPAVACVTGKIVPLAVETPEQRWMESYAGFSKGERRRTFDLNGHRPDDALFPYTAGQFGSGANMAFRTEVLRGLGGFDPALGAGSGAYGGDDLAAFFEVITQGHRLVYEPGALVRHEHHSDEQALRRMMFGYGAGLTAYLTKTVIDRPSRIPSLIAKAPLGLWYGLSSRSRRNRRRAVDQPPSLRRREVLGMLVGPWAYVRARRQARTVTEGAQV